MKMTIAFAAASCLLSASASIAQVPTDAQIASIVVTANSVDIDAGKYATLRARNKDVKAFAE